ncbi:hypothetical protein EDB81DRAFT_914385 [Dactylonectria macrodidyma]|uniref:Uncharacterized protein n=1 Tax=Dactylonectria macrodidyma TaxID=307937 RepID=A0A9P9DKI7_9HYPO|nr:hypothetical protein EDB81DRAFT_914385 [Dactylonectria macrodidyma]
MRGIFRTDSDKKPKKEARQENTIKQGRKDRTPGAGGGASSHASDSAGNGSLRATLGGNANANESVISFFTALSSIEVPPTEGPPTSTEASLLEASPTEASFDLESDTDSAFSLHQATPVIVCSSPTWMIEHVDILERFGDDPQQESISKRDAVYISSFDRPSIVLFTSHDSASPLLRHQDSHHMALEPCHFVQTFTEGSFISRSTHVTTTVRTSGDDDLGLSSQVTITGGADSTSPARPSSSGTRSQSPFRALMSRSKRSPVLLSTLKQTQSPSVSSRGDVTEGWKPPTTWDCTLSTKNSLSEMAVVTDEITVLDEDLLTDLSVVQQDVNRVTKKSKQFEGTKSVQRDGRDRTNAAYAMDNGSAGS